MQLKVSLPSGQVTVPVDSQSTPGHLKENLKYSLKVPPKLIKLTSDGKELDDMQQLVGEPNNLSDGAVVVAEAREGVPEEVAKETKPAGKQPVMIKKEEPPKPKKPKKDVVRPVLSEGDVVKSKTLKAGHTPWTPKYLEGAHPKRHLAFLRIQVGGASSTPVQMAPQTKVRIFNLKAKPELNGTEGILQKFDEEKGRWQTKLSNGKVLEIKPDNLELDDATGKCYPEQGDDTLVIALGDPQVSPVWDAAVQLMEIGEKAEFTISKKVIDFDVEGLVPTDSSSTWRIELQQLEEAIDVQQDYQQLLHVERAGSEAEKAEALDWVALHWRVRRWMAEGAPCIASSRERIAIMPGYGLVPIEDQNAPPVRVSVGEGQVPAMELVALHLGTGGIGHLYLKTEALKDQRPSGCIIMQVEVIGVELNRGPGSKAWLGWQTLVSERHMGDQWLEDADDKRKKLETFGTLSKSTNQTKDAEAHIASEVKKAANNAARRYRRSLEWLQSEDQEDRKIKGERSTVQMRLAKASALAHQRFGEAAEAEATEEEKLALAEALKMLEDVHTAAEASGAEATSYECLKMKLQVHIQAQDVENARQVLEVLQSMKQEDDELKSDSARINRLEGTLTLKKGASAIEDLQKDMQAAITAKDLPKVGECLDTVLDMITGGKVTWDTVRTLKVGKDVGNAMKLEDKDLAAKGRKVVQEIQALAQRAGIGL